MTLTKSQTKNEKKENLCDLQCCGDACILILWLHFTSPPLKGEFSERACLFEDVYWVTECEIAGWEWAVLSVNCWGGGEATNADMCLFAPEQRGEMFGN